MPFNGSGLFERVYNWATDKANGIKIRADRMDAEMDGFATGLSNTITKDGQTAITANIPFASFRLTGLGAASDRTDAVQAAQIQDSSLTYFTATGTDTYVLSPSPAISAYAEGQRWTVKFTNANTGAATLNVSGQGAAAIQKDGVALTASDIRAGGVYGVVYDGTQFQIFGLPATQRLQDGGRQTSNFTSVAGRRYRVSSAVSTVTAPASPSDGNEVLLEVEGGRTSSLTWGRNSQNVKGVAEDGVLPSSFEGQKLMTFTTGRGWI